MVIYLGLEILSIRHGFDSRDLNTGEVSLSLFRKQADCTRTLNLNGPVFLVSI